MLKRVLQSWIQELEKKPVDPGTRMQLAQMILQEGSPSCEKRVLDTKNNFDPGGSVAEQVLVSIPKRDNWVTIIESMDFRYVNPGGDDLIDAYVGMLRMNKAESWLLPRFTFSDNLDDVFGPKKLLNGPFVLIREQAAEFVLNPGLTSGTTANQFQVLTRFNIRYEEQWLMERLGLVEPNDFPDKGPPVLGGR